VTEWVSAWISKWVHDWVSDWHKWVTACKMTKFTIHASINNLSWRHHAWHTIQSCHTSCLYINLPVFLQQSWVQSQQTEKLHSQNSTWYLMAWHPHVPHSCARGTPAHMPSLCSIFARCIKACYCHDNHLLWVCNGGCMIGMCLVDIDDPHSERHQWYWL